MVFGVMTFAFPMAFGTAAGALLVWGLNRRCCWARCWRRTRSCSIRWSGARGWRTTGGASAVGRPVLTDTLALTILAVITGTESGTGSSAEIALQLVRSAWPRSPSSASWCCHG